VSEWQDALLSIWGILYSFLRQNAIPRITRGGESGGISGEILILLAGNSGGTSVVVVRLSRTGRNAWEGTVSGKTSELRFPGGQA
jgi:hypothetical protein